MYWVGRISAILSIVIGLTTFSKPDPLWTSMFVGGIAALVAMRWRNSIMMILACGVNLVLVYFAITLLAVAGADEARRPAAIVAILGIVMGGFSVAGVLLPIPASVLRKRQVQRLSDEAYKLLDEGQKAARRGDRQEAARIYTLVVDQYKGTKFDEDARALLNAINAEITGSQTVR